MADHSALSHLECSRTGTSYDADRVQGVSEVGAPLLARYDLDRVRAHVLGVPGVLDVHDLHAWTITSGQPVLSAHVVVSEEALADGHGGRVLDALCSCLGAHFDLEHCTFQLEPVGHQAHELAHHD